MDPLGGLGIEWTTKATTAKKGSRLLAPPLWGKDGCSGGISTACPKRKPLDFTKVCAVLKLAPWCLMRKPRGGMRPSFDESDASQMQGKIDDAWPLLFSLSTCRVNGFGTQLCFLV